MRRERGEGGKREKERGRRRGEREREGERERGERGREGEREKERERESLHISTHSYTQMVGGGGGGGGGESIPASPAFDEHTVPRDHRGDQLW